MRDKHLNIFHAYRGAVADDEIRTRQLEDNLTRALVITVATLTHAQACGRLLQALGLGWFRAGEELECHLQVSAPEPHWPSPAARRLLVIHGGPELEILDSEESKTVGSRVDAVIASRSALVAIESKVGNKVHAGQLGRHCEALTIIHDTPLAITWTDVVGALRQIRTEFKLDPVSRFVSEQLEEYLRMNGFGGLTHESFAFFAEQPERRDSLIKDGIRRSLTTLLEELKSQWQTPWQVHLGNIQDNADGAWGTLEPPHSAGQRRVRPHLTLEIRADGLEIFANVETTHPYRQFLRSWKEDPGGFIGLLRDLANTANPMSAQVSNPWRLSVIQRVQASSRPRDFLYWPAIDVAPVAFRSMPDDEFAAFIDGTVRPLEGHAPPEIRLVRRHPGLAVVRDDVSIDLLSDATTLEPFFEWLGEPVR